VDPNHTSGVNMASFSPDGRRIVTASGDNTARVWNAESGAEINCLKDYRRVASDDYADQSASFSPDGRRILTACDETTARVWHSESGAQIPILNANIEKVLSASFSPDGRRIVTASSDGTVRVWDVARSEAMGQECAIVITAALARGIGWRTEDEVADLLMQDAPEDVYAAARKQLLDPMKLSADEIARRESALQESIAAVLAPIHPNCYLSPTQFAEKFGLSLPGKVVDEPELEEKDGEDIPEHGNIDAVGQDIHENSLTFGTLVPDRNAHRPIWLERAAWLAAIVTSVATTFIAARP
jgi:WD40 repeat protein